MLVIQNFSMNILGRGGWIQGKSEYKSTISKEITYFHSDADTLIIQNTQIIIYNSYGAECEKSKRWKAHLKSTPLMTCQALGAGCCCCCWGFCAFSAVCTVCTSVVAEVPLLLTCNRRTNGTEYRLEQKKTFVIGGAVAHDEVAKQEQFKQCQKKVKK